MELAGRPSIYKRGESLMSRCDVSRRALVVGVPVRSAPLAALLEAPFSGLKIIPHTLYKVHPGHHPAPLALQFLGFPPLFLKIFKNFFAPSARHCPPCAESPRRTFTQTKTPEFRGKTPRSHLAITPKSPLKHRPRALKNPPLTPLHIKKLSKVRSTLLTAPPGGCILEYMRLKEAAQTTPHGAARAAPTASKTFKLTRLALEEAGH